MSYLLKNQYYKHISKQRQRFPIKLNKKLYSSIFHVEESYWDRGNFKYSLCNAHTALVLCNILILYYIAASTDEILGHSIQPFGQSFPFCSSSKWASRVWNTFDAPWHSPWHQPASPGGRQVHQAVLLQHRCRAHSPYRMNCWRLYLTSRPSVTQWIICNIHGKVNGPSS